MSERGSRTFARGWLGAIVFAASLGAGCSGWDPRKPFERAAPEVERAIAAMERGELVAAEQVLGEYLGTGVCDAGQIGLGDRARSRPDGTFDLGLVLFGLAEKYGAPFEAAPSPAPSSGAAPAPPPAGSSAPGAPEPTSDEAKRDEEIRCALVVTLAIASDERVAGELRARAYYLAGNLELLRKRYREAIRNYDRALAFAPGRPENDGGDPVGRDAAHNRAVALRRLEEEQKQEPPPHPSSQPSSQPQEPPPSPSGAPSSPPPEPSGAPDEPPPSPSGSPSSPPPEPSNAPNEPPPSPSSAPGAPEPSDDGAGDPPPQGPNPERDSPPTPAQPGPEGPSGPQGDRILDRFDQTPTFQQEEAKRRGEAKRRAMEDK